MFRYVHTNIIAKDPKRLIAFYKEVLNCKSFNSTRDLKGEWVDLLRALRMRISWENIWSFQVMKINCQL